MGEKQNKALISEEGNSESQFMGERDLPPMCQQKHQTLDPLLTKLEHQTSTMNDNIF
jgi:hypothetical protein